jgi:predicted amidohydrolase YtcJ
VFDPGGYNFPLEAYQTLWKIRDQKELTIRIAYSLSAPKKDSELFDFQRMIKRLPQDDEYLSWNGIGENVTWGMYNNESPQPKDQEVLKEVLDWAAKEKITATFHWNNNLTIQSLLDVIEQVQLKHPD